MAQPSANRRNETQTSPIRVYFAREDRPCGQAHSAPIRASYTGRPGENALRDDRMVGLFIVGLRLEHSDGRSRYRGHTPSLSRPSSRALRPVRVPRATTSARYCNSVGPGPAFVETETLPPAICPTAVSVEHHRSAQAFARASGRDG